MELPPAPFELSPAAPSGLLTSPQRRLELPADGAVPLIRGFQATAPSAQTARLERRRQRAGLGEKVLGLDGPLGLKARGEQARGLLGGQDDEDGLVIGRKAGVKKVRKKKNKGEDGEGVVERSLEELEGEVKAVEDDMANVVVRRVSAFASLDRCRGLTTFVSRLPGCAEWSDWRG